MIAPLTSTSIKIVLFRIESSFTVLAFYSNGIIGPTTPTMWGPCIAKIISFYTQWVIFKLPFDEYPLLTFRSTYRFATQTNQFFWVHPISIIDIPVLNTRTPSLIRSMIHIQLRFFGWNSGVSSPTVSTHSDIVDSPYNFLHIFIFRIDYYRCKMEPPVAPTGMQRSSGR